MLTIARVKDKGQRERGKGEIGRRRMGKRGMWKVEREMGKG
jgi:hypothetical protein